MLRSEDIMATLSMFQKEHLDVRTVTMGLNLMDCASPDIDHLCRKIHRKIVDRAGRLVSVCDAIGARYGIPVVNRRVAVSPISAVAASHGIGGFLQVARALDEAAREIGVNFVGGYTALVQKGITAGERALIESLPEALSTTERVCSSVNVASTKAGINMDAILLLGEVIVRTAQRTAASDGFGCAKLVVFANMPEDNPFMAGAYLGYGEPECVINIGVSGPGVVKSALQRLAQSGGQIDLGTIAEEIKMTSFRVTRGRRTDRARGGGGAGRGLRHRGPVAGADPGRRRQRRRDSADHGHRRHRRSGLHRRVGDAQRRGEEGRAVCLLVGRRALRRFHPGQRRPGPGGGRGRGTCASRSWRP